MNLSEIEERVAAIDGADGVDFVYELLAAYGLPKASISRLRTGSYNKAEREDERLWKGKVWFRDAEGVGDDELYRLIDAAKSGELVAQMKPRFLIVHNGDRILASDTRTGGTLDVVAGGLAANASFFLPWAGIEKTQLENLNVADVKAAEKMAKLYDEITKHNEIETEESIHDLNVFFSRLLFCFFAEDTGIFTEGSFTNAIGSLTEESGADTSAFLDKLFLVLNTEPAERGAIAPHLRDFGYVNGKLFERRCQVPHFTAKARAIILECGTLDWSQINPDIFGSMIQAVVHPSRREGLGMHYTSVENIMKVIRPLFLDELEEAFDAADTVRKLERLRARITKIQIFDPACGSGNFLVIAYKELRRLEHRILERISELEPHRRQMFTYSEIELDNFYGIEIDDFAHEVAILSLWLAKHQMNLEFKELFGVDIPLIPLVEAGQIVCGNAARLEWGEVCEGSAAETFVLGNPPYLGGTLQSEENKLDLASAFAGGIVNRYMDYVSIWLYKGARYVMETDAQLGLVVTNSVCQGNHVNLLWPQIKDVGAEIAFAHSSFLWSNSARGQAGVTCAIIGLSRPGARKVKRFYDGLSVRSAGSINSYLVPEGPDVIVAQRRQPMSPVPPMVFGSMPRDGGGLVLSQEERNELVRQAPAALSLVRRYMGSDELIKDKYRYCLWIGDHEVEAAAAFPAISERLTRVALARAASTAKSTRDYADKPHLFVQRAHRETAAIVVPGVSSERRDYVPMGFVDDGTIVSNLANAIYGADLWLFGLIHSRMHMAWVLAIGGRLESRIRYSASLVYNTFPVPTLTDEDRASLTERAIAVLGAREQHPDRTLAELYDPDKMPPNLRQAHRELDEAVDLLYNPRGLESDEDRLARLFEMYEAALAAEAEGESCADA